MLDAYSAARSALSGHGVSEPKDERIGVVRALLSARRSAVKARTASINQMKTLLVTAPEVVRDRFRKVATKQLIVALTQGSRLCCGCVETAGGSATTPSQPLWPKVTGQHGFTTALPKRSSPPGEWSSPAAPAS
ncbi:hypothetical protein [Nocardia coffeae]|uniref:hypothetical protein n=1 Tax=Nocardia coffeae TaxID=2873381 RepID=UPI001F19CA1A|nr:hypothetical protein [Nocardia coffeae]